MRRDNRAVLDRRPDPTAHAPAPAPAPAPIPAFGLGPIPAIGHAPAGGTEHQGVDAALAAADDFPRLKPQAQTSEAPSPGPGARPSVLRRAGAVLTFLIGWLRQAKRRREQRMALLALSDDALKDIGISRSQAYGNDSRYRRNASHALERKVF